MKKNIMVWGVVGAVVVAGAAFYGGYAYAKAGTPARGQFAAGQFAGRAGGAGATGAAGFARTGGGATTGQIISKDATSVTVKMADGSTKLVLIATSTPVLMTSAGTLSSLSVGANVVVTGSANSDGSVTAQSVMLRPAGAAAPGRSQTQ